MPSIIYDLRATFKLLVRYIVPSDSMRFVLVAAVFLFALLLFGCTNLRYPNHTDCQSDLGCFNELLDKNCTNAYAVVDFIWNPDVKIEYVSTNRGTYCAINVKYEKDGKQIGHVDKELVLPVTRCPFLGAVKGYKTTQGNCEMLDV